MVFETACGADSGVRKGSMRIGYARVSKREQNLDLQLSMLRAAGCERIFFEKIGATAKHRPELEKALAALRSGDQLVVYKLDRFARDLLAQLLMLRDLQMRGASLVTLTECVDTSDWMGGIMTRQYALYAEVELNRIRERTRDGLRVAREKGVALGRKRKLSERQASAARRMMKDGDMTAAMIAHRFGVARATLFRHLRAAR